MKQRTDRERGFKMTNYFVLNAKGVMVGNFTNEKEAKEYLNKGLKRGWKWTLETVTHNTHNPEVWEMAGCKQDTTKVDWGKNWMLQ